MHIEIRSPRDNFLHAGFLSPPVSDRASLIERSSPTNLTLTTPQDTVLICALAPRASYTGLILARSSVRLSSRQPDTSSPTPCGHTEGTTHQLTHPPQTRNWPSHPPLTVPHLAPTSDSRTSSPSYPSDSGEALAGHVPIGHVSDMSTSCARATSDAKSGRCTGVSHRHVSMAECCGGCGGDESSHSKYSHSKCGHSRCRHSRCSHSKFSSSKCSSSKYGLSTCGSGGETSSISAISAAEAKPSTTPRTHAPKHLLG